MAIIAVGSTFGLIINIGLLGAWDLEGYHAVSALCQLTPIFFLFEITFYYFLFIFWLNYPNSNIYNFIIKYRYSSLLTFTVVARSRYCRAFPRFKNVVSVLAGTPPSVWLRF